MVDFPKSGHICDTLGCYYVLVAQLSTRNNEKCNYTINQREKERKIRNDTWMIHK